MTDATSVYPEAPVDAARMYAWLDWRVAPVRPGSKVPAISDWVNAASDDIDTINAWYDGEHAAAGVCVVTGKASGLWALDVDVANGKPGLETLKALVAEHGSLPETIVARTPSGGYHYLFSYPEDAEVHNSASNRLGAGLDVRGEGGQINVAPTRRGDAAYRWAEGRGPYDVEIQPAPDWLLDLVKDEPRPEAPPAVPTMTPAAAKAHSVTLQALDGVPGFVTDYNAAHSWDELLTADGWQRCHEAGDSTYWARPGKSCRGRDGGISASTGYAGSDLLYVWSTSIDWLPSERAYDRYGYHVMRVFNADFDAAAKHFVGERREREGVGQRIDPADLLPGSPPAVKTDEDAEPDDEPEPTKFEAALMRLDDPDFWNADPTAKDFLIEPFIARGRAHALYATAKSGKSYVALQAIAAAAVPGHDSWSVTPAEPVRVLWLDYEMTEDDLRERLQIFGYGVDDDFSNLRYVKASLLGADLDTKDGGRELLEQAQAWGSQLVVVDTMSRAVSGDENDADTVRKFYQHTGRLLKAHGIAWLRIDHAGKVAEAGQRGSSAKNDDVDIVFRLDRLDAGAKLTRTHSRVFWIDDEILLRNVPHPDGSVHHERTESLADVRGTDAKAREWLRLGIDPDASRETLRAEGLEFRNDELGSLRRRVKELSSVGPTEPRYLFGGPSSPGPVP